MEVRIDVGRRRDQRWGALTRRWRSRRNCRGGGGAGDVVGPSILDEVREELRLAGMTLGDDGES